MKKKRLYIHSVGADNREGRGDTIHLKQGGSTT